MPVDRAAERAPLLDMAVHELRSPLTVVEGYASLLASGDLGHLDDAAANAARVIATKAREAQEMVTTLLTVARLESDDLRIERAAFALRPVLDRVVDRVRPRVDLAGASVSCSVSEGLEAVGDVSLVTRILDNIVNNALAYSDPPASVRLSARPEAGGIAVRVSDSGIGITEGERDRIFERFVRGAGAERASGTGLGLYVSRECARRMQGDLVLESSGSEEGSTFMLRLPAT